MCVFVMMLAVTSEETVMDTESKAKVMSKFVNVSLNCYHVDLLGDSGQVLQPICARCFFLILCNLSQICTLGAGMRGPGWATARPKNQKYQPWSENFEAIVRQ